MQKLMRNAARHRRHADKRAAVNANWRQRSERADMDEQNNQSKLELRINARREAKRRRDDYLLGPLSPWRQNMANKIEEGFGTLNSSMLANTTDQRDAQEFEKMQNNMLRVGDRVAIIRGHRTYKNQIGKIKQKGDNRAEFKVESLHQVDVENESSSGDGRTTKTERFIPARDLALVYPIPNPQNNNIPEDCIIALENLAPVHIRRDPFQNDKRVYDRIIRPQNIVIPWPEESEPAVRDEEIDTLRIESETETYYPRLMSPPMPPTVLDELRNKFSKMRRRHEPWFVENLEKADEIAEREAARSKALLPGVDQRQERPAVRMSDELANAIGGWMAANKTAKQPHAEPRSSDSNGPPPA